MFRSHTCGDLRINDVGSKVSLCGWVHKVRDKGKIIWIDLRDKYGITQLIFEDSNTDSNTFLKARNCGREFVLKVIGLVSERSAKNKNFWRTCFNAKQICVNHDEEVNFIISSTYKLYVCRYPW